MKDLTMVQRFQQARTAFDQSVQEVADELGYSRMYIYECLKYPNKNIDLHNEIRAYIKSAGIDLPANKVAPTNA